MLKLASCKVIIRPSVKPSPAPAVVQDISVVDSATTFPPEFLAIMASRDLIELSSITSESFSISCVLNHECFQSTW